MPRAIITRKIEAPVSYKLARGHALPSEPVFWAITYHDREYDTFSVRVTWEPKLTPHDAALITYGMRPVPGMTFYNLGADQVEMRVKLKSVPLAPVE